MIEDEEEREREKKKKKSLGASDVGGLEINGCICASEMDARYRSQAALNIAPAHARGAYG